ncbi:MAG: GTP-binding protein TypA/BipA [Firmicutes bacterium ADurb.Bin193]|nr:MAG: GTP-binding protein TypA/BipA [Firmicutes bacterium ADurb.Bin193]
MQKENIRNVAIIAHVDHGKTTLVDALLKQSGIFRENEQVADCIMDSGDLERERGITILSKNTSVMYGDIKINIVDTPGHADFGGEVERVMEMVDGVLLLVDAFEGCMPQTRFVLKKALSRNLKPIIVINKTDRPGARPYEVVDEVLELFMDLDATESQFDAPVIYFSGREGWAALDPETRGGDMKPLFEMIAKHVPPPPGDKDKPFQMIVSNIDYDDYVGRIAVGRINRGTVKIGQNVAVCGADGAVRSGKISKMYMFEGLKRVEVQTAQAGDIICMSGLTGVSIGETVCDPDCIEPLAAIEIDEPAISVTFSVNNGPFAGQEGTYVTSRHIKDRLEKELETNVSLRVTETDSPDSFEVAGRGELHLSILIETMRRQGYEFMVSRPVVINKIIDGVLCEPVERLTVDVPDEYTGVVIEKLGSRRAQMTNMHPINQGYTRVEFKIPSRGIIGYRSELMTDTKGTGILNHYIDGYEPVSGEIALRRRGSLVAFETGEAVTYGLYNAQERGRLFIGAGTRVYEGMVVGENARPEDIVVNVCKKKHVANIRASGSDDALRLTPHEILSLENCLEFIGDDELIEVTPKSLRIRKRILNAEFRAKSRSR